MLFGPYFCRCLRCPLDCPALDLSWNPLHGARMPPTTTNPNPHKRLSNGLYLSVSTSVLAARADNGGIGIWSLSSLLGWEDGTPAPWRKRALKATAHAPVERGVLAPVATFDAPFFPCSTRHLEGRPRDRAEVWVGDSWVAALSQTAGVAGGESHLHHHTGKQQELLFFRM